MRFHQIKTTVKQIPPLTKMFLFTIYLLFLHPSAPKCQILDTNEIVYNQQFEQIIASNMEDSLKIKYILDSLHNNQFKRLSKVTQAPLLILKKGISIAKRNEYDLQIGHLKEKEGKEYSRLNFRAGARDAYEASLGSYQKAGSLSDQLRLRSTLFGYCSVTSAFDVGIQHGYKALEICKSLNDEVALANMYLFFSSAYINMGMAPEGVTYAKNGLEIFKERKDINGIADGNFRIAACYTRIDSFELAMKHINKTIDLAEKNPDKIDHAILVERILTRSQVYMDAEKHLEALADMDLAESMSNEKELKSMRTRNWFKRGKCYRKLGWNQKAKKEYLKAYHDPNRDLNGYLTYCVEGLVRTFENLNQLDSAHIYNMELAQILESSNFHESKLNLKNIKTKYETAQKDQTIALQNQTIAQKNTIQLVTAGFLGLLAFLLIQAFRNAKKRKEAVLILEQTNQRLAIQNKQNEVLLKEIHHRVKNNLQTISSLLSLQSSTIKDRSALDAVQESRNRVGSMALIHQKLYQGENLAAIEMRDYFETIGSTIISSFGAKAKGIELEVNMSDMELDVDTAIPIGLITNELITNSLKYAFQGKESGKILISMTKEENNLIQLSIADDGINNSTGISEEGTGFGTMLVNLLTTQLSGQLEQSTEQGTNTTIQFRLTTKAA